MKQENKPEIITITGDNNGNLVIPSLSPGSSSDSNVINVNVVTNNIYAYSNLDEMLEIVTKIVDGH